MSFLINPYVFEQPADTLPHRYWRVNVTAVSSSNLVGIGEIQLYETPFGPNVAVGGTAAADTEFDANHVAANAFDQTVYTQSVSGQNAWASTATALPHWISYDFGAGNEKAIRTIGLHARGPDSSAQRPTAFDVQYSDDGSSWTTAWSESGLTLGNVCGFVRSIHPNEVPSYSGSPHGAHEYWRLYQFRDETVNSQEVGAGEMEWRAVPGGSEVTTGGTVTASSTFSSNVPTRLFDGNTGTNWLSADNQEWGWVKYQFAAPTEIAEITVWCHSSVPANTAKHMIMQYSDDNSTWTTAWAIENEAVWTAGQNRTFADPNYI